ncbi:hypothetical protein DRQ53_01520 [bacterium]|nr:MAG: hypothetical protein DRQ32_10055 [bacterium]RKZ18091.1 MAG: hypothetical protein DRQ53_01520 [bacterium]
MGPSAYDHTTTRYATLALLVACWLVCVANTLTEPVNRDEHMYLAAASLSAEHQVYRDFAFLQTPYSIAVYRAVGAVAPDDQTLLAARLFKCLLTAAMIGAMYFLLRRVGASPPMAALLVTLLYLSALVREMAALARNYDLAQLAILLALCLIPLRGQEATSRWRWALSGALGGLAIGFKLSYAPLALITLAWPVLTEAPSRLRCTGLVLAGALFALLPLIVTFASVDGDVLRFDLVEYHYINAEFHAMEGHDPHASMLGRAREDWALLGSAGQWPLLGMLLLSLGLASGPWRRFRNTTGERHNTALMLALAFVTGAILMAVIPRPPQKFYLVPVLFGLALLAGTRVGRLNRAGLRLLMVVCVIGVIVGAGVRGSQLAGLLDTALQRENWPATQVHEVGRVLAAESGRVRPVATTHPIYALQAGREIYPELAAAEFTWRSGDLLAAARRDRFVIASPVTLDKLLAQRPPSAVLIERDAPWDGPLVRWATEQDWRAQVGPDSNVIFYTP